MAEARRMGKSELFSHFAERFELKRAQAREFFDELTALAEKELKRSGEFTLRRAEAQSANGPQPGHGRGDQDSRQDRREGANREANERRGSAAQVGRSLQSGRPTSPTRIRARWGEISTH